MPARRWAVRDNCQSQLARRGAPVNPLLPLLLIPLLQPLEGLTRGKDGGTLCEPPVVGEHDIQRHLTRDGPPVAARDAPRSRLDVIRAVAIHCLWFRWLRIQLDDACTRRARWKRQHCDAPRAVAPARAYASISV